MAGITGVFFYRKENLQAYGCFFTYNLVNSIFAFVQTIVSFSIEEFVWQAVLIFAIGFANLVLGCNVAKEKNLSVRNHHLQTNLLSQPNTQFNYNIPPPPSSQYPAQAQAQAQSGYPPYQQQPPPPPQYYQSTTPNYYGYHPGPPPTGYQPGAPSQPTGY